MRLKVLPQNLIFSKVETERYIERTCLDACEGSNNIQDSCESFCDLFEIKVDETDNNSTSGCESVSNSDKFVFIITTTCV